MNNIDRLILLTICLNFFIPLAVGHGFGFLGMIEIFWPKQFIDGTVKLSLIDNHHDRLFTAAIIATVGQIILIIAYLRKKQTQKVKAVYTGLFILLLSYFVLSIEFSTSTFDRFSFFGGLPPYFFSV
jgi:hypothetical protein